LKPGRTDPELTAFVCDHALRLDKYIFSDLEVTALCRRQKSTAGRRYACLFHTANYAHNVEGCIGPGEKRTIDPEKNLIMVTNSAATMTEIRSRLSWESGHSCRIFQVPGAVDTPLVTK